MSIDLAALGFTQEELQTRVIDQIVERVLTGVYFDEDGDEVLRSSRFAAELNKKIQERIDTTINAIAEKHLLPNVGTYIENLVLQRTTSWGEKQGEPYSFIQYLIHRAEVYMSQDVDRNGRSAEECRQRSDSFYKAGPRVATMVDQHLHLSIETAMKQALANANSQIAGGITSAVKSSLEEITGKLKVAVAIK